ncbi:DnaD domain protein [Exiguobacterium sp. SH5S4]|uniref:DnaD domain protein n=1 Tax=Exiguobacterium sp. SH5S4 TaxID=2510961 RepID=UPI00103FADBB|nr:DnaD domain protein [Exiguobacterium sp. SH5S4]TCI25546.1 DnaD domain protein [Exiguobacterium sp. SH5S4]
MSVYRTVQTDFWKDPKIMEEFTPEDKLFYLYLLTNPNTTQCGIYGITKKEMAFQLGYSTETVNALMDRFITYHKLIDYNVETRELVIYNWAKYNFKRGGKPVQDLIKSELAKVKHQPYIEIVGKHVPIDGIRQVYESYYESYDESCHESCDVSLDESPDQSCNESTHESSSEESLNKAILKTNDESYHESYDESSEKNGQTETKTKTETKAETKQQQQQKKEPLTNDAAVAAQLSDLVSFYELNISTATPFVIGKLEDMIEDASYESARYALEQAVAQEKRTLNYVQRIVDRCIAQKLFTFELIRLQEQRRQQQHAGTNPDAKSPEWLEKEERESREHAALKKAELESQVPDEAELAKLMSELKGGASA